MHTETLTDQQQNIDRTYFIVFDNDGNIHKINSSPITELTDSDLTQIQSNNPICKKLLKGQANIRNYGIIWDIVSEQWNISRSSTKLVLEPKHNKLLPFLNNVSKDDTEIFVSIYYNDNTAVVYANKEKIKSIKNLSDIREISTEETKLLDIYITKKNDPDYLVAILKLNPLELFKSGSQIIDLDTDITRHVDWQNISMYGKAVFNNYGWNLLDTQHSVPSASTNTVLQSSNVSDRNDININVVDNILHLTSNLSSEQDYYFEGYSKLRIVVCDNSPDNLLGAIEVPVSALLENNTYTTEINFKWPAKPLLLYKSNYITINTGEKNVR
jgi:hypothetical protein